MRLPRRQLRSSRGARNFFGNNRDTCASKEFDGNKACFALFPLTLGGRNMPALLGYLVALAIFLGGGYVGLEWLASPEDFSTVQRPVKKLAPNKNVPKFASTVAGAAVVPSEADDKLKAETTASTAVSKGLGRAGHEMAASASGAGDLGKTEKTNGVPAGGCMPIGLTAQGDPMTCQELMERHRGPVALSTTETAPSIKENRGVELAEPEKSSNVANQTAELPHNNTADNTGRTDVPKIDELKPSEPTSGPDTTRKALSGSGTDVHADQSQRHGEELLTPGAVKPSAAQSPPTVKSRRLERQQSQSQRSNLVRMTLRTIEFSDGHREQRLLPIRRSPRAAVDAADQW
jgi:hypothetical protein